MQVCTKCNFVSEIKRNGVVHEFENLGHIVRSVIV